MADELSGAEDPKGKAVEELPGVDHAGYGLNLKPCLGLEVIGEIVDFGDGCGEVESLVELLNALQIS